MKKDRVILLVEDNADDELLTLRALKKNQFSDPVIVARDGAEALDYLFATGAYAGHDASDQPQVVLLDLNLLCVDGREVLRRWRANVRTQLLPVIVLTSSKEEDDIARSYRHGANSYVRKPVNFTDFLEVVKHLGVYWLLLNEGPPARWGA